MFVRTDEGIYELTDNMTIETGVYSFFGKVYNTTKKHLFRNDNDLGEFVAQSENLDELCDGFYIDEGNEFSFYEENAYEDFEEAKEVFKQEFDDTSTLYGFIKTSKGLIYVAKMDSDPILKLF